MLDTGCLGMVHWDDPEGWYGEGGGRGVQDGEHVYTHGCMAKPIQYCKVISLQLKYINLYFKKFKKKKKKSRGTRDQIANIRWIIEQESSRKTSISALLTMPKLLTVWIITNCKKFLKRWEYQTT